jgi:RNA polymerase sigma-70 factor, ECF subfamily
VESKVAALFREHGRYVFRLLRRLGVPDADVDDVFQEVFVIVHRKLPELDPRTPLRAWVYGICVRRAANYRKRNRTRREVPTEETIERADTEQTTPSEAVDARKARQILDAILRGLPDQKREVFVLYVIEELPMQEVADALGCPLHTAYSRLYAARKLVEDGIRRARAQMGQP